MKNTQGVFLIFILIIMSRENELLCFDQSTKLGDADHFYVPEGSHCLQQPLLCISQESGCDQATSH